MIGYNLLRQVGGLPPGVRLNVLNRSIKIWGGPYREIPCADDGTPYPFGICVAAEIVHKCDVKVHVHDFSIPNGREAERIWINAAVAGIRAALRGRMVYVGCLGGVGRTGMMLATMAKISGCSDPVTHIREQYNGHAVETLEQMKFIRTLNVDAARSRLKRRRFYRWLTLGLMRW